MVFPIEGHHNFSGYSYKITMINLQGVLFFFGWCALFLLLQERIFLIGVPFQKSKEGNLPDCPAKVAQLKSE